MFCTLEKENKYKTLTNYDPSPMARCIPTSEILQCEKMIKYVRVKGMVQMKKNT